MVVVISFFFYVVTVGLVDGVFSYVQYDVTQQYACPFLLSFYMYNSGLFSSSFCLAKYMINTFTNFTIQVFTSICHFLHIVHWYSLLQPAIVFRCQQTLNPRQWNTFYAPSAGPRQRHTWQKRTLTWKIPLFVVVRYYQTLKLCQWYRLGAVLRWFFLSVQQFNGKCFVLRESRRYEWRTW